MAPIATYRLQLHAAFTFDDVREIVDYLRDLGVSHAYFSPYLQAAEGSTHGYDVVDHNRVNEELGGASGHHDMCEALGRAGLGQVLDVVPNHMAVGTRENAWWWDLLENGPSSRYAHFFDVEWDPPEKRLQNLLLVPVLGDHFGRILEAGELRLERERGKFIVRYHDKVYPVAPKSLPIILSKAVELCQSEELAFICDGFGSLPLATATDEASVTRRHRDKEILARQLGELVSGEPEVAAAVDHAVHELNHNHDALDEFLAQQNFRLSYWRTARRELGYRRFFDINTLAGLRMEDDRVFEETHRLVTAWLRRGVIDGVRIDHPDGLRDPEEYFDRLRKAAPKAWIVAEKILEPGERLRSSWCVDGTTGYDFIYRAGGLFIDSRSEQPLSTLYGEFTSRSIDYPRVVRKRKEQILRETLGSDLNRLTADFMQVCERHRRFRDFTRHDIHHALREVVIAFPVYRTYVRPPTGVVQEDDRKYIHTAVDEAKMHRPDLPPDLFDFLRSVLLLQITGALESEFVYRFQQFTGPAMAKGVEDTTFYAFNRLIALNEVGGDPGHFGVSTEEFHRLNAEAQQQWPEAMLATSTHDTKRSEDVRCRIAVLSEIPQKWGDAVAQWSALNEKHREDDLPDRNIEYMLYQTLVGAWPIELDRLKNYMEKASREAKTYTSWVDPNPDYDEALQKFVTAVYNDAEFMDSMAAFAGKLTHSGRVNSLALNVLKLTCPGVPDVYQGTEIWDLSLVDPDNRRTVDYDLRRRLLREAAQMNAEQVLTRMDEGLPKIWLIQRCLNLRRRMLPAFGPRASYTALQATGPKAEHAVAYMRSDSVLAIVPRLVHTLRNEWNDTVIHVPEGQWKNVLTEESVSSGTVRVADLLHRFPVAVLERG